MKVIQAGSMALAIGTALGGLPSVALAQDGKPLTIDVSGGVLYDSNVARGSAAAAQSRDITPKDTRFSPAISAIVNLPIGIHRVSLTGSAGYDFYARNTRLNRERIQFDGTASLNLAICHVDVRGNFSRRQSDLADLSITPGAERTSTKNVQTGKGAGTTISCGSPIGVRPVVMIDWADARNSADARKTSDNSTTTYAGGILYTNPVIGDITLYAGKREADYPNRDPLLTAALGSFDAERYGVIFSRDIGAQLTLSGEILYTDVKLGNGRKGFNGVNWRGNAKLTLSQFQITGETSRSVDPSLGFDANFIVQRNQNLSIRYAINDRLSAQLAGSVAIRDFDYEPGLAVLGIVHDNHKRVTAGLDFAVNNKMTFALETGYQRRNANGNLYDYDGYRVGLRVSRSF